MLYIVDRIRKCKLKYKWAMTLVISQSIRNCSAYSLTSFILWDTRGLNVPYDLWWLVFHQKIISTAHTYYCRQTKRTRGQMDVAQDTGPRECTLFASHGPSFTWRCIYRWFLRRGAYEPPENPYQCEYIRIRHP